MSKINIIWDLNRDKNLLLIGLVKLDLDPQICILY